jgi:predicted O-methyltransferase YrrM
VTEAPLRAFETSRQPTRSGLDFATFYERYGASLRRKHLVIVAPSRVGRLSLAVAALVGRIPLNKRHWTLPAQSRLPLEFIRLEPWEAEYLYLLARRATRGIVEIGRFRGGSTFLLACANNRVPIWSIDIAPQDDLALRRLLGENDLGQNVNLLVGDSHLKTFPVIGDFDLLFVDGDHSYAGCRADLDRFVPRLASAGHLAVHDCYAGGDVHDAVLDFAEGSDLVPVRSPYIINSHWHTGCGSIAHFTKSPDPGPALRV